MGDEMNFAEFLGYLRALIIACDTSTDAMMPDSHSFQVSLDYDAQSWLLLDKAVSICVDNGEGDFIIVKENGLWQRA